MSFILAFAFAILGSCIIWLVAYIIILKEEIMDKKIKKIEKTVKKDSMKEEKELKGLAKADKKRDKVCDMGEKMMKKKKK